MGTKEPDLGVEKGPLGFHLDPTIARDGGVCLGRGKN